VPAIAVVALAIVGFCCVDVKLFGPLHAYVAPVTIGVLSEMVDPTQYGPPFDAVGVAGFAVMLRVTVAVLLVPALPVAVSVKESPPL
jgi:hypothetical protein